MVCDSFLNFFSRQVFWVSDHLHSALMASPRYYPSLVNKILISPYL